MPVCHSPAVLALSDLGKYQMFSKTGYIVRKNTKQQKGLNPVLNKSKQNETLTNIHLAPLISFGNLLDFFYVGMSLCIDTKPSHEPFFLIR